MAGLAAQNIGRLVHDQIFVVEPSHKPPGGPGPRAVIEADLDLLLGGQGVEIGILPHAQQGRHAIRQHLDLYPAFRRGQQGRQDLPPGGVRAEFEGGQDDSLPGVGDQADALRQGLPIVPQKRGPLAPISGTAEGHFLELLLGLTADRGLKKKGDHCAHQQKHQVKQESGSQSFDALDQHLDPLIFSLARHCAPAGPRWHPW